MSRTYHFAEAQLFTCLHGRPEEPLADRASMRHDSGNDVAERDRTLAFVAHSANCHADLLAALGKLVTMLDTGFEPDESTMVTARAAIAKAEAVRS
jgi:hypothetical protein